MSNEKGPILIRKAENTRKYDDPDDARYVIIETEEEKEYLEWLVEKGRYSVIGLRSKLTGMRLYEEWLDQKAKKIEIEADDPEEAKYEALGKVLQEEKEGLAKLEREEPAQKRRQNNETTKGD